jgi:ubiquitin-conjugating enzyme E2 variant
MGSINAAAETAATLSYSDAALPGSDDITDPDFRARLVDDHTSVFRKVEVASTFVFISASAYLLWLLRDYFAANPSYAFAAFVSGWVAADFVSGVVHWAGDTWGTTQWFLVGQTLIRTFREHHVDEKAITRHDFVETNGTNCLISLPILFACLWAAPSFLVVSMFSLVLWVFATNQIHKWAHQDSRPAWVSAFQRAGLVLSPEHHAIHHKSPFAKYYCITTGWLNRPLLVMGFFRRSEQLITALTGAIPRAHDLQTVDKVLKAR